MSRVPPYFIMPIVASTGFCIVIALVPVLMLPHKTHFPWWGALIFGVPASLIGTLVFAPMATYFRNRPIGYVALCGVAGVALGYFGSAILWNLLLSIGSGGPPSDPTFSLIIYATATATGCINGIVFALGTYALVALHIARMRKASDDKHP